GARRKLEKDTAPVATDAAELDELIGQNARERLTAVKRGLRSILDLLSSNGAEGFHLAPPVVTSAAVRRRAAAARRAKAPRGGKTTAARNGSGRSALARRKRSA